MHGHSPGFALIEKTDNMGGFMDCEVGLDTKTSPRSAAIEKAQAELRQEYDVREQRRKELEFLEKGGNPLDFKFGRAASISLQSTSFTDQQAEQYATSEAKGSFALAASPHGESAESSGRPAGHVIREPNIADNLLLFDGENSKGGGERNGKQKGKRGIGSLAEQSSTADGCDNVKETEDSLIFHLGAKRRAYTRRNRSRISRDNHTNKSTPPSSIKTENHGIPVSNSIPANMDVDPPKGLASANQLDMELDGVQTHLASTNMIKDGLQEKAAEVSIPEIMQDVDHFNQHTKAPADLAANLAVSKPSDIIGKGESTSVGFSSVSREPNGNAKEISSTERVGGSSISDKDLTNVLNDDLNRNNCVVGDAAEVGLNSTGKYTSHTDKENNTSGNAMNDNSRAVKGVEGRPTGDSRESSYSQRDSDLNVVREKCLLIGLAAPVTGNDEPLPVHLNPGGTTVRIKEEVDTCNNRTDILNEVKPVANAENLKMKGEVVPETERKLGATFIDSSDSVNKAGIITSSLVAPTCEPSSGAFYKRGTIATSAVQNSAGNHLKLAKRAREDAILKEARIIEANLKRVGKLSMSISYKPTEKRRKSHWDFVLEEMAWMANDFMQERVWKTAAATHLCHQIMSPGRSNFEQNIIYRKQKSIARTLAKAIMHFWHSVDVLRNETPELLNKECDSDLFRSSKVDVTTAEEDQAGKCEEAESTGRHCTIQAYAIRFMKYDISTSTPAILTEAPTTPDRINDSGIVETSLEDELSEGSLLYRVPPGAMRLYGESVESQWKMDNSMLQEGCEASLCESLPDGPCENDYEAEEEGETGSHLPPGTVDGTMSSKCTYKKNKNFQQKSYASRQYDITSDFHNDPFLEGKPVNQALVFTGRRPSIPTKRVRTAARQRVVSPFGAAATGNLQLTNKTDVSSGDTNSYQDDRSSMHGGAQSRINMEVESKMDFDKHSPFDGSGISLKLKKKSKHSVYSANHSDGVLMASGQGSMFDQRPQADSLVQHEQRDQVKRRPENQHFESNGKIGACGQPAAKKPKFIKQLIEPSPEGVISATGSMPSPVASQMSNMSSQNKLIKIMANRDRGKKNKTMKMSAGQSGSGIPWTTFEDQALVVFVHDMGPNWELVSDAINGTLQFKCIFRKPKECKERHKFLLDKSSGDGADSAEDSGSSQPYPSTLPGIPKGSAGQLFQRLQGPMVEDTLRAHFEKIILIGQKLHSRRSQKDSSEMKQTTPVHSSHVVALSQTCPNNLAGGVLSPLELCDALSSSPDVLTLGYQGSHASSGALQNHQGSPSPVISSSNMNSILQGSSGTVLGNNIPAPSTTLNAPPRDGQRYCMPRGPADDQQRIHYARILSGRNVQQPNMSGTGALSMGVDRGSYILPNGNGMGMMGGRPMPRPGFQGIGSPGMPVVPASSMVAGSGVGMPNPTSIHPVPVSGPGNSIFRPRDVLPMLRPGHNTEDRRQAMMQDLHTQPSQGNAPALPSFSALSAPFPPVTGLPTVPSYPAQHHQPSHQIQQQQPHMLANPHHPHIQTNNHPNPQHQAYAMHIAKERQLQQRLMPQSQQPYSSSNSTPTVPKLEQQNQPSSSTAPTPPQAQHNKAQIQQNPPQSNARMPNQAMKQKQRQHLQLQQPRQQQQQPKQMSQQQAKVMKGVNRSPALMHQNMTVDPSQVSGSPAGTRSLAAEKHLMQQSQGFFNTNLPQSLNNQRQYSRPPPQSSKQMIPLSSHSDNCNQSPVAVSKNHTLLSSQQPPLPSSTPSASPPLQLQRHVSQNMQRIVLQPNRQLSSDGRTQSSCDQAQVKQTVPDASVPSTSSTHMASSATQWKPEPSRDPSTTSATGRLAGSPQENLVGNEFLIHSSGEGLEPKQFSRSMSMDTRTVGGQWQAQQQPVSQSPMQQQQPQHPNQQVVQGNLHSRPSNSGPS